MHVMEQSNWKIIQDGKYIKYHNTITNEYRYDIPIDIFPWVHVLFFKNNKLNIII